MATVIIQGIVGSIVCGILKRVWLKVFPALRRSVGVALLLLACIALKEVDVKTECERVSGLFKRRKQFTKDEEAAVKNLPKDNSVEKTTDFESLSHSGGAINVECDCPQKEKRLKSM